MTGSIDHTVAADRTNQRAEAFVIHTAPQRQLSTVDLFYRNFKQCVWHDRLLSLRAKCGTVQRKKAQSSRGTLDFLETISGCSGSFPFALGHVLSQLERAQSAGVYGVIDDRYASRTEFSQIRLDHNGKSPNLTPPSGQDDVVSKFVLELGLEGPCSTGRWGRRVREVTDTLG